MFSDIFRRARPRQTIKAKTVNDLQRKVEGLGRLRANPPIGLVQLLDGVQVLYWSGPLTDLTYFVPTSGPIPAASGSVSGGNLTLGSGQAKRYYRDPDSNQLKDWGQGPLTIYNFAPSPSGSTSTVLVCALIDGDWTIVAEACPSS